MNAHSARVAVPEDAHPYWCELLARCGLGVERLGASSLDPVALLLPDAAGSTSKASLREVQRLRGRGVPIVAGAEWGARLLGGRTRAVSALGLGGVGHLSPAAPGVRMPVRVHVLERATEGRLWPSGARAVAWSSDVAPLCVLPLADAGDLLVAASELTAFACGENQVVSELVAAVDHGALRHLVLGALRATSSAAARPLVRKAPAPGEHGGVFAYRVDADGFRPEATAATLAALSAGHVRATWFLDVERHLLGPCEPAIAAMRALGHEVHSHFFRHYTYKSRGKNESNLQRSLVELRRLGVEANAAAAPFGAWNEGLHAALRGSGMRWSSEFSRLYDDVPCELSGKSIDPTEPWQVPVHPICPALLLQRGFTEPQVVAYFAARLDERLDRGDPAVFYGHPIGELERLPSLFVELDRALSRWARPVWKATLGELFEFERARREQQVECRVDGCLIEGATHGPAGLWIESVGRRSYVAGGSFALSWELGGHEPLGRPEPRAETGAPGREESGQWRPAVRRAALWRGRRLRLARLAREARR